MVTSEEITQVPLFSSLSAAERERLSRVCADIRLAPGEYAVHEGDERALFVVLEGKIEVVKVVDGIERTLGERLPGHDLRRGADHARHAVPGRLPRGRAVARHADRRAATTTRSRPRRPKWRVEIGALARERIGGLQGIAAEPPKPRAIVVGHRWDAACRELRRFLDRNQITFDWLTPDAAGRWPSAGAAPLPADDDCPALRSPTGRRWCGRSCARSPSCSACRRAPPPREYDTVIIGGGPAGLAAAVYGASEGLRTLVIEREAPGRPGRHLVADRELPRLPDGVSGDELASRALQQARRLGAEILVTRIDQRASIRRTRSVHLDGGDVLRGAHDHPRHRRDLAAPRDRRLRPADRQGHLLRRGAQRGARARTGSTSTSSAPATRPARRRCSSPTTRAR